MGVLAGGANLSKKRGKMAKKDKRGALFCLKKKKMYEAEISA